MLILVRSIQRACLKCPLTAFYMPGASGGTNCCINLGLEASQLRSLAQRKFWTALACNVGTCQALHPTRDIPVY